MSEPTKRTLGALLIAVAVLGAGLVLRATVDESLGGNVALIGGVGVIACVLVLGMELLKTEKR